MVNIPIILEDEECKPIYSSSQASGADVRAFIAESITLHPGEKQKLYRGVRVRVGGGFWGGRSE